jgi:chondroitin 4-sulfotransferase 11/chondroitin 4-sulfotransferase 13/dermatan 4-sulfotransferase 1
MSHPSLIHTIWLEPQQTAFVYLPKVACTSWKLFFARALDLPFPEQLSYGQVHAQASLPLPYVGAMAAEAQQRFLAQQAAGNIRLHAVIRHPRQRILSAYLDKIALHRNPESFFSQQVLPSIQAQAGLAADQRPSFEQFLGWLNAAATPLTQNDHWLPMVNLLGLAGPEALPPQAYTRIWPMDELELAADHFRRLLGVELPFPGNEALGPRPSTGSGELVASHFNPAAEALFQTRFGADLELYEGLRSGPAQPAAADRSQESGPGRC